MKRIIIITGASSGIGQEFARQIMGFRQAQELCEELYINEDAEETDG